MSDIVERLRTRASGVRFMASWTHEAADELERLRALLRAIMDDTSDGQESMSFDIRDRIERALGPSHERHRRAAARFGA